MKKVENLKKELPDIKGAIFDLDGTLLDSTWVWDQVDVEFLGKRGFEVPKDYAQEIAHMGADRAAKYTIERFGLNETVDDIVAEWFHMVKDKYACEVQCKENALQCVEKLYKMGIKIAIATASDIVLFEETLKRTGLDKYIFSIVMVKEVKRGKAFPDVYLESARRLGTKPNQTIVFEDIVAGICGANRGGFTTVAVYEKRSEKDLDVIKGEADFYINSFSELL